MQPGLSTHVFLQQRLHPALLAAILRALDNALAAIQHPKTLAHHPAVKTLLENLQNEVTTPEHLLQILRVGHFTNVGIALDLGHAHLAGPHAIDEAIELLKPRIA